MTRQRPASLAVRTALAKVLRLVADDLEEQLSGLVAVVVGGDDPPALLWLALRLDRNAEFRDEPFGRLAVGHTGVRPDEVKGAAANLVLVVVPLAALVAGDLDGERSVRAEAQLRARRQRAVRLAEAARAPRLRSARSDDRRPRQTRAHAVRSRRWAEPRSDQSRITSPFSARVIAV